MKRLYLLIAVFILSFFISGNTFADTTYTIKKGDNPSRIAKKFKVRVQDIIEVNNLRPEHLKPGTEITIPSNKNESLHNENTSAREQDEKSHVDAVETSGNQEDAPYHVVKKGDTLSSLSKKYYIPVSEIKEINNLRSSKIKAGQKLLIKRIGPRTYTVRKGDTIQKIARRFNIDADELREINDLETDLLRPGQKLFLETEVDMDGLKIYDAVSLEEEIKKVSESEEHTLTEKLILLAQKLLNIPYRFGGSSLFGIDCSAYVQKVYGMIGMELPRSAREQFKEGEHVDKEELSIGDLVFFRTYASFPSHVGIYLGNDLFIHASSKDRRVTIGSLNAPYYLKRFIGAKRVIGEEGPHDEFLPSALNPQITGNQ